MRTFVVYADYALIAAATAEEQARMAEALPDAEACVWIEDRQPMLLRACFDLAAADLTDAISKARAAVVTASGQAQLKGPPVKVTAMTEDGQATWMLGDDSA